MWRIKNDEQILSRKSHKTCQEIQELRRICCEETNRVRQLRIDELSIQQERGPTTVCQLLSQIRGLQNKANSLSEERDFHDPETPSSSGASHVPTEPLAIPSTRSTHCRHSGLPPYTRNSTGTPGNVFESLLAREVSPSVLLENSRNLASSSCGLRPA